MSINPKKVSGGLRELKYDERDFKLGAVFELCSIEEVSKETFFVTIPVAIDDQGENDFCTAFTVTSISEDQEETELSEHYQFARTKEIENEDYTNWGADLRDACKVLVKYGSLTKDVANEYMKTNNIDPNNRDDVANWKNWSHELDAMAAKHKKQTYFKITGPYDTFDNIRAALCTFAKEKRTIAVGAVWRDEWTRAKDGIIEEGYGQSGFGHAFKIIGQKLFGENDLRIVAQLSNGADIGDNGLFYFPRNIVNREFSPFGQFVFKDMPREEAEELIASGIKKSDSWIVRIFKKLLSIFK